MDTKRLPEPGHNNVWFRHSNADAALVFIHGILSDSRGCWLNCDPSNPQAQSYWPSLIEADARFHDIPIYLAGYHTAPNSGPYEVRNCADEVFHALMREGLAGLPPVMAKKKITFVCHSMGGIVARYLLETNARAFEDKQVGLVLIASPSYGSQLANSLSNLMSVFNHQQGLNLQLGSWSLKELDDRFRELLHHNRIPGLCGVELYENRFVVHRKWLPIFTRALVVTKESAGRYFGAPKQIPASDHFTICKPRSQTDLVHQYLLDFLSDHALLPDPTAVTALKAPQDSIGVPGNASGPVEVKLVLEPSQDFLGGTARVLTAAALMNRARKRTTEHVQISLELRGLALAQARQRELDTQPARTDTEEFEYRHLFVLIDFLTDRAVVLMKHAIELAANDDRLREGNLLSLDERLAQFIVGIRDAVFGFGVPVFLGEENGYPWVDEARARPHEWNLWWRRDPSLCTCMRVSDSDAHDIDRTFRRNAEGRRVFGDRAAFDLYALRLDTFYGTALPRVALVIVTRWPNRAEIPDDALDLRQWLFSPARADDADWLEPVGTTEFRRQLAPGSA